MTTRWIAAPPAAGERRWPSGSKRNGAERLAGVALVLALHGAVGYALWSYRMLPVPSAARTLFVDFISPQPPQAETQPPQRPKPKPIDRPRTAPPPAPPQIVAEAPVLSPAEPVAPPPPPVPVRAAPDPPPAPRPAPAAPPRPVNLQTDLAASCPERLPPAYPALSRKLGEEGRVVVRVELDEGGRVTAAQISSSSGSQRLDDAALGAVRQWRCHPARRDGATVAAVGLQPFNFILAGH